MSEEVKNTTGEERGIPKQPGSNSADVASKESPQKTPDISEKKTPERPEEKTPEGPAGRIPEKPEEKSTGSSKEKTPARTDENPRERPEEKSTGRPAEKPPDIPKEKTPDEPEENSTDRSVEKNADIRENSVPERPGENQGNHPENQTEKPAADPEKKTSDILKKNGRGKTPGESSESSGREDRSADEDEPISGDMSFSEDEQLPEDEPISEDEAFFDEEEEPVSRGFPFHFRFPKIRIRTKKIAEQEKARRLSEEAVLSEESDETEEAGGVGDNTRQEEHVIWIPAGLAAVIIIVAVVVVSALGAILGTVYWKYRGYEVVDSRKQEDTMSASYCSAGDNILRYSTDGASLISRSGTALWDVSYSMNDPEVAMCGDIMAVYDRDGTNIVVCDASGEIGTMSTSLPIVRAKVCETGAVAALMQDSSNAYVEYYDKKGAKIATIKTSMDNPGFPLDIALSDDGQNIAVSYLSYDSSGQKSIVRFYNFGSAGQNQMDNRIADFQYSNVIIPQLEYLDSQTCVAFRSDGFSVYGGESSVKETATVSTDQKIQSVFHDATRIGMIVNAADSGDFDLLVYNTAGRQLLDREFNFAYRSVEFTGDEISLYNGAKICVFNMYGVEKFNGSYNGTPQEIFSIGKHRYVVVKENSLDMIRLK